MLQSFHFKAVIMVFAMAGLACASAPACAHPHVWVTFETTVAYEGGSISGLRQRWTFDEFYTAMAIQGLDANNDGVYDKQELSELAKINVEGLKEFDYFTYARLGETSLPLRDPVDYWLEYTNGILSLHFTLPLEQPVLAEADGFTFSVYDPTYFIAFDLAKENPVQLAEGAPPGCKASVGVPQKEATDAQQLGEAFFSQLGGSANYGVGYAKTISVSCPRS